ncbi:MAG: hypothetical protein JSR44_09680 [Spirochaetes bacterium]|nr:hypothetical protein [Spirochaetota bacterium]
MRRVFLVGVAMLVAMPGCKKAQEILPREATQVTRADRTEMIDSAQVSVREYRFALKDQPMGSVFVCEARRFTDAESAAVAAKKSIAERPEEDLTAPQKRFARSGRSVWLLKNENLVWCMFASKVLTDFTKALAPLREVFLENYK